MTRNPQAVLDVLEFYSENLANEAEIYSYPKPALPFPRANREELMRKKSNKTKMPKSPENILPMKVRISLTPGDKK
jgi:hypothetical protein